MFYVHASVTGVTSQATFGLYNTGVPTQVAVSSGSNQSTALNTQYATPLRALVTDVVGTPLAGVSVVFSSPVSGAGGVFGASGLLVTVTTNSSGIATAPAFTSNGTIGTFTVVATAGGYSATPAYFTLTNQAAGGATNIAAATSSTQTTTVGTAFSSGLQVKVTNASNNPVAGVSVTFAAPTSGPGGTFGSSTASQVVVTTDANGFATIPTFTANTIAGNYAVSATLAGLSPVIFSLTNAPGAVTTISATAGTSQSALPNTAFATKLTVLLRDAYGNAVPGAALTFAAPSATLGGTFVGGGSTFSTTTNASGLATAPVLTANGSAGDFSVTVSSGSAQATFPFAVLGTPAALSLQSGSGQSVTVNTAFAPVQVKVVDASGNPVPNASVIFSVPSSGPGGRFTGGLSSTVVVTNTAGLATSPTLTASSTAGGFAMTVTSGAASLSVPFVSTAATAPASLTFLSFSNPSAPAGTTYQSTLKVLVEDANGNPVPGSLVDFSVPTYGASGRFTPSSTTDVVETTDSNGVASAPPLIANRLVGEFQVTASSLSAAPGAVPPSATLYLANLPGNPANVVITAGASQSAVVQSTFATTLSVQVTDLGGNPVPGAAVTFVAPTSGASGVFPLFNGSYYDETPTNAQGMATAVFAANGVAGTYNVSVYVSGVYTTPTFAMVNTPLPGSPATITDLAGDAQTALVGSTYGTNLQVVVRDSSGNPVPGRTVTFTAPTSALGGLFTNGTNVATVTTDSSGVATAPAYTAGSAGGANVVSSTVVGLGNPAVFNLVNSSNPPNALTPVVGTSNQTAAIGTVYTTPFQVVVTDQNNAKLSGVTVTFSAPATGAAGTFLNGTTTATAVTNGNGVATAPSFTANSTAGAFTIIASAAGANGNSVQSTFSLTNTPGAPTALTLTQGSATSEVGIAYPMLSAIVTDAYNNPIPNASVSFAVPTSGATGSFPGSATVVQATTDLSGVVYAPTFVADTIAGQFAMTVRVAGLAAAQTILLTNRPGAAVQFFSQSGSSQSTEVGTPFASVLKTTAVDAYGNPVPGASVTFSTPASGASATFSGTNVATVTTDANGVATSPVPTANTTSGGYFVYAALGGNSAQNLFYLTNNPAGQISVVSAGVIFAGVNAALFQNQPTGNVQVASFSDFVNNGAPNPQNYTAPITTPSGTVFPGIVTLNSNNFLVVSGSLTLATAGRYSLTVTLNRAVGGSATASVPITVAADVDNQVSVVSKTIKLNKSTGYYNASVTIKNTGTSAFNFSRFLMLVNSIQNAVVVDANLITTGTGQVALPYYYNITVAVGGSVTWMFSLKQTGSGAINFGLLLYSY